MFLGNSWAYGNAKRGGGKNHINEKAKQNRFLMKGRVLCKLYESEC